MKSFVLDTNVLIHDPEALFTFEGGRIIIPLIVVEELDRFKRSNDDRGRNARLVSRYLDELRQHGKLSDGVPLEHGGQLKVEVQARAKLPSTFDSSSMDNRILEMALGLAEQGDQVIFITKDINLRIKAESIGLVAEDYEKEKIHPEHLYLGWRELVLPSEEIDKFFKLKKLEPTVNSWKPNEMVILRSHENGGSQSALARYDSKAKVLTPLRHSNDKPWGLKPLNTEQKFAMELLMDPDVELVSLVGVPGSGKTLLALAAGLEQILERKKYRRMLVARPIVPVGNDIGFLPGTKEEKLESWMGAIYDNLEYLMDHSSYTDDDEGFSRGKGSRTRSTDLDEDEKADVNALFESGQIVAEAVAYLRGRTLPNQFIVIDDAQNLTPHEVKTIISRVGQGSKVVFTGDPYQIDNPYLDAASTGLANMVDKFKGQPIYGHMTFSKTERSSLAALASELL